MSAQIECTPSTRKSQGGTSRPSISAKGRTNPPMQASTWQLASTAAARAAISGSGRPRPADTGAPSRRRARCIVPHGAPSPRRRLPSRRQPPSCDAHAEQVGRLVERGVRALGDDDLRLGDSPLDTAPLAGGLDRAQDRLRAPARQEPRPPCPHRGAAPPSSPPPPTGSARATGRPPCSARSRAGTAMPPARRPRGPTARRRRPG